MKRIIYNTKLKKFFIAIIIVMTVICAVFPNVVWAGSFAEWIANKIADAAYEVYETTWDGVFDPNQLWNIGTPYAYTSLGRLFPSGNIPETEDEKLQTIATNYVRTMGEQFPNGLTEERAKELMSAHKTDLKIYLLATEIPASDPMPEYYQYTFYLFDLELTAAEQDEFGITDFDVDPEPWEEDPEDQADVGGILLSPVFYLINFIADAITSNLGTIMIGDDASFGSVTGIGVLQRDAITPDPDTYYYPYDVDTTSFVLGEIQYPNIQYTPEEIFAGKVDLLSIDFISGNNYEGQPNENTGWQDIRYVISEWYKVIRMIAIIGLLSVLIYTGVKIIISANAKDKAKYKEWIINWFIAVAILFFMHYIMAFIISVTSELSKLIANATQQIKIVNSSDGTESVSNLMGLVRFMIQSEDFYTKVGYEVMYIALIVYTVKFTFVYLKRVLNMAFLTLIAPIVALTYPIDKLNDGQAQGFNMWLKEYIFNALLQPMHCVMYYILVGAAIGIAASNPIYGIVVLAFMAEAEKLLKRIFGFDKAGGGTVGGMAGAFAAGAIASSVKDIARMAKLPGGNAGKGSGGSSGSDKNGIYDNPKPIGDKLDVMRDFGGGADGGAALVGAGGGSGGNAGGSAGAQPSTSIMTSSPETSNNLEQERQRLASERSVLQEFEEEGATSDNWTDGDYEAFDQLEQEQLAREQALGQAQQPQVQTQTPAQAPAQTPVRTQNQTPAQSPAPSNSPTTSSRSSRLQNFKKGSKAVFKKMAKPVWDFDHTGQAGRRYNGKRLLRNTLKTAGKAALGFSLGTAAAAVQAGISITDGKYNPMEGMATFTAGAVGGGKIVNAIGSGGKNIYDTYKEGTLPDDPNDRKIEIMKRAQERFADREDVIKFNNSEYKPEERQSRMERERDHYLKNGYADLKKMKSGMKYADSLLKGTDMSNMTDAQKKAEWEKADKRAISSMKFIDMLESQGQSDAINNMELQRNYIAARTQGKTQAEARQIEAAYNNAFRSARAFYDAQ